MGTYTANYNLFMPTVGEQGWGELVNGNFTTIDATLKGLSNRATALENADTTFDVRLQPFEEHISFDSDGSLVTDSVKVNRVYVIPELSTQYGDIVYATNTQPSLSANYENNAPSGTRTTSTITVNGYNINSNITFPLKVGMGMYIEDRSDLVVPKLTGLTATFSWDTYTNYNSPMATVYKNGVSVCTGTGDYSKTFTVNEGDTLYVQYRAGSYLTSKDYRAIFSLTIAKAPDLRIW